MSGTGLTDVHRWIGSPRCSRTDCGSQISQDLVDQLRLKIYIYGWSLKGSRLFLQDYASCHPSACSLTSHNVRLTTTAIAIIASCVRGDAPDRIVH